MLFIFYFICLFSILHGGLTLDVITDPSNWKTIEALAEEYPYIAAILNHEKECICTGIVIDRRVILSSGACVTPEPLYVSVGTAVFHSQLNNNSIFQVASTKLHNDYIFDINENELNISRMHSNIGLVYTVLPILEDFFESAVLSNYYASELKAKQLVMVGFGSLKISDGVVLQQQTYHQVACKNPKWYYCVCGIEYSPITYDEPFGEGGPILYGNEIVGIAASPSGSLKYKSKIHYNIFTVISPYIAWIEKSKLDSIVQFTAEPIGNNGILEISSNLLMYTSMFFIKMIL